MCDDVPKVRRKDSVKKKHRKDSEFTLFKPARTIFDPDTNSVDITQISEHDLTGFECLQEKSMAINEHVRRLQVRDKRHIFQLMRQKENLSASHFLPGYGLSVGEFSVGHLLSENTTRARRHSAADDEDPGKQEAQD